MCGFCNVWVCKCGFCNVWVCICVGFVMCVCVCVCVRECVWLKSQVLMKEISLCSVNLPNNEARWKKIQNFKCYSRWCIWLPLGFKQFCKIIKLYLSYGNFGQIKKKKKINLLPNFQIQSSPFCDLARRRFRNSLPTSRYNTSAPSWRVNHIKKSNQIPTYAA